MGKWLSMLAGIILIIVGLGIMWQWPTIFWENLLRVIAGCIPPFLILLGLILLLIGKEEAATEEAVEEVKEEVAPEIEEEKPKRRKKRKKKK